MTPWLVSIREDLAASGRSHDGRWRWEIWGRAGVSAPRKASRAACSVSTSNVASWPRISVTQGIDETSNEDQLLMREAWSEEKVFSSGEVSKGWMPASWLIKRRGVVRKSPPLGEKAIKWAMVLTAALCRLI